MKIYRTPLIDSGESDGYIYHTSKREAQKASNEQKKSIHYDGMSLSEDIEIFDVKLNKKGIMSFLNVYCSYPDNG